MLEPLFINQESGNWPYAFSIHDLGNSFPNATGHNDGQGKMNRPSKERDTNLLADEMQPLEECGDMLVSCKVHTVGLLDMLTISSDHDPCVRSASQ
jgi:hypothetical protein